VWVCRDAAQPMVDVHHSLLREVTIMARNLHKIHGIRVAEDKHLQGNSVRKEDEDELRPEFASNSMEKDMAEAMAAVQQSDELLEKWLEATIRQLLDFMVKKNWKKLAGKLVQSVALAVEMTHHLPSSQIHAFQHFSMTKHTILLVVMYMWGEHL
jgi:polyphosphate kinase